MHIKGTCTSHYPRERLLASGNYPGVETSDRCVLGITSRDGFKLSLVFSVRYFLVVEKGLLRISWDLSSWKLLK